MQFLRQSTAVDVLIGPFVDSTDGFTSEAGLSPAVSVSKNGQALAAKSDVTVPVYDSLGYYNCEFDATDTGTVGTLVAVVAGSATALPYRGEFQVMDEVAYDALYGTSATILTSEDVGLLFEEAILTVTNQTTFIMTTNFVNDSLYRYNLCTIYKAATGESHTTWIASLTAATDVITIDSAAVFTVVAGDTLRIFAMQHPRAAVNNAALLTTAAFDTNAASVRAKIHLLARSDAAAVTDYASDLTDINTDEGSGAGNFDPAVDSLEAQADGSALIVADTNELQTDWANGGRLDLIIDAILADTNEVQTDLANGGRLDLLVDAIKLTTDKLVFTVANQVDANIQSINDANVVGDGTAGSLWRDV